MSRWRYCKCADNVMNLPSNGDLASWAATRESGMAGRIGGMCLLWATAFPLSPFNDPIDPDMSHTARQLSSVPASLSCPTSVFHCASTTWTFVSPSSFLNSSSFGFFFFASWYPIPESDTASAARVRGKSVALLIDFFSNSTERSTP